MAGGGVGEVVGDRFDLADGVVEVVGEVRDLVDEVRDLVDDVWDLVNEVWNLVDDAWNLVDEVRNLVNEVWNLIDEVGNLVNAVFRTPSYTSVTPPLTSQVASMTQNDSPMRSVRRIYKCRQHELHLNSPVSTMTSFPSTIDLAPASSALSLLRPSEIMRTASSFSNFTTCS